MAWYSHKKRSTTFYIHCFAYWLLTLSFLLIRWNYKREKANAEWSIERMSTELQYHYIPEKNQLIWIVDEINQKREIKKELCEKIPYEFRTEFETKICW